MHLVSKTIKDLLMNVGRNELVPVVSQIMSLQERSHA